MKVEFFDGGDVEAANVHGTSFCTLCPKAAAWCLQAAKMLEFSRAKEVYQGWGKNRANRLETDVNSEIW